MRIQFFHMEADDFCFVDTDLDGSLDIGYPHPGSWMAERAAELFRERDNDIDEVDGIAEELAGWYWWHCESGCLPDSDAHGPFETETDAAIDAIDSGDMPMPVSVSVSDGIVHLTESWERIVTFYAHKAFAKHDQSIMGSNWEIPKDMMEAYAGTTISGAGEWTDEAEDAAVESLLDELRDLGYEPELL